MTLDKQQELAVKTDADKVLVAASAGSGKTRTIIERIKFLVEQGVEPKKIYAITFTNAAAEEMRSRIGDNTEVFVGTIHSLANRILLSNSVDTQKSIDDENFDWLLEQIHERDLYLPEIDHLLVDEFQDICENEYNFMLNDLKPKNFFAVGDSRQAIYGFKGANYQYFMDLARDPDVSVFELNRNYRSGEEIIDFADATICSIRDIYRTVVISMSEYSSYVEEDYFSIEKILSIFDGVEDFNNWFVLCRTNAEVDMMLTIFKKNNIPAESFKKADLDLNSLKEKMNENTVKVLTIHTSKGLEADNVVVVGSKRWNDEEKRISYVAATRARKNLYWLFDKKKTYQKKKSSLNLDF